LRFVFHRLCFKSGKTKKSGVMKSTALKTAALTASKSMSMSTLLGPVEKRVILPAPGAIVAPGAIRQIFRHKKNPPPPQALGKKKEKKR
jgi:hypothetical protein